MRDNLFFIKSTDWNTSLQFWIETSGVLILGITVWKYSPAKFLSRRRRHSYRAFFTMWGNLASIILFYYYLSSCTYMTYFNDVHLSLFHPWELPKTSTSKFHVPFYFYFWQPTESNPKPLCAQVLSQSLEYGATLPKKYDRPSPSNHQGQLSIASQLGVGACEPLPHAGNAGMLTDSILYRASQIPTAAELSEGKDWVMSPGLCFTALLPIFRLSHSFRSLSCAAC